MNKTADQISKLVPSLKARWLEALRSGRYPQGRMCLKTEDGRFCCLGVALDVIDSGQWSGLGWGDRADSDELPRFAMDETIRLGGELGIPGRICELLATFNDGRTAADCRDDEEPLEALSFSQIADWIEANL